MPWLHPSGIHLWRSSPAGTTSCRSPESSQLYEALVLLASLEFEKDGKITSVPNPAYDTYLTRYQ
jgi:hypothetical protein